MMPSTPALAAGTGLPISRRAVVAGAIATSLVTAEAARSSFTGPGRYMYRWLVNETIPAHIERNTFAEGFPWAITPVDPSSTALFGTMYFGTSDVEKCIVSRMGA